jgi:hypothetical protein
MSYSHGIGTSSSCNRIAAAAMPSRTSRRKSSGPEASSCGGLIQVPRPGGGILVIVSGRGEVTVTDLCRRASPRSKSGVDRPGWSWSRLRWRCRSGNGPVIFSSGQSLNADRVKAGRIDLKLTTSAIFSTSPSITALQNLSSSSLNPNKYDCAKRDHSASS